MSYEAYMRDCAVLREKGDWRGLFKLAQRRFERHQKPSTLVHMCEALLLGDDIAGFDAQCERLTSLDPDWPELPRLHALRAEAVDEPARAIAHWRDYAARQPGKPTPWFNIAGILLRGERYLEFVAALANLRDAYGDHPKLRHLEHQLSQAVGRQSAAELRASALQLSADRAWRAARGRWELLAIKLPGDVQAWLRVCDCCLELGEVHDAWSIIRQHYALLKSAPRLPDLARRTLSRLAAEPGDLRSLVDDAVLAHFEPAEIAAYARILAARRDSDLDLADLLGHLERRAAGGALRAAAAVLMEAKNLPWASRFAASARAAGAAGPAAADLDFMSLLLAWKSGRLDECLPLIEHYRGRPEAILASADRFATYCMIYHRRFGCDKFLYELVAAALDSILGDTCALFDLVEFVAREGASDFLATIAEACRATDDAHARGLGHLSRVFLGPPSDDCTAEPVDPGFFDSCRDLRRADQSRFERLAETLFVRGDLLLLEHLFATLEPDDETAKVVRLRAQMASQLGHWDAAAGLWTSIVERNRHDAWAQINRTNALINAARPADARDALTALGNLREMAGGPLRAELAACAARLGDRDAATAIALEVVEKIEARDLRSHQRTMLARILNLSGLPEKAWPLYKEKSIEPIDGRANLAVILDPGLTVSSGHHVNYNLFAWRVIRNLCGEGVDLTPLILSRDPVENSSELAHLRVVPALNFEPYAYDDQPMLHQSLTGLNKAFHHDLSQLKFARDVEFVFVHSMRATMIDGFSRWVAEIFAKARGFVVIGLIEVDHLIEADEILDGYVEVYRGALRRLAANRNIGLLLYVETESGKRFIDDLRVPGVEVRVFPYLAASLCLDYRSMAPADPAAPICLGTVGGTRTTRGSHLMPGLIDATQDLADRCRWKVQLNMRTLAGITEEADLAHVETFCRRPNVNVIDRVLSAEDYFGLLNSIDVVVLPYQDRYAVSGSGVLYESIYMGKFLLVPRRTFMPGVLAELGHPHLVFDEATPACLEAAVRRVVARQDDIKQNLASMRAERRQRLPSDEFQQLVADGIRRAERQDAFA